MHLVGIVEDLFRVSLPSVDYQEDGLVSAGQREAVQQVGQRASGRQRHVETPQRARRRPSLQRRVQMNTDSEVYQLNMLSKSASEAS